MSFLDRFKPLPRWKHADAAVRVAAVAEVPGDAEHRPVLLELATEDPDIRVRRTAAARLTFAEDLVRAARGEKDEELRRTLTDRLVSLASAPANDDGEAALALEGIDDQRQLSTVAKQSPHDTVRTAALGRVHDVRSLGSVARHAADPRTALEAVARIADRAELINIALKTDHKDAGLAALERALAAGDDDTRATLDTVAARAKNKAVVKQARSMLHALDQAETERRAAQEAWQQRVAGAVALMEACASAAPGPSTASRLAEAEAAWGDVAREGTFPVDETTAARYHSLADSARAAVTRYEDEEAARRAAEEQRLSALAVATALCARVEETRGEDALDQIATARAEWEGLAIHPADPEAAALRDRFSAACERAAERHRNREALQRAQVRLDELAAAADKTASTAPLDEAAWSAIAREWDQVSGSADGVGGEAADKYRAAAARVEERRAERRAAAERAARQQLQRVDALIDRAQKRAAADDLTLREADRLARDLRGSLDTLATTVPEERERHVIAERLRQAQTAIAPRVHDLREMDEWKRFANAAVQEELIAKTEALRVKYGFETRGSAGSRGSRGSGGSNSEPSAAVAVESAERVEPPQPVENSERVENSEPLEPPEPPEPLEPPEPHLTDEDLDRLAKELHDIQERWKTVAEAPRAQAQALWHRYRQAADPLQTRVREFFAHRNQERRGNLERKTALVERAEALADSTDWIKTADELKRLQTEWRQVGPVPRQESRVTWKRFRDACDKFFSRRQADLAERKEAWTANLARKEELCKRAEEIAGSTDWERGASEIRRLQAEWKTVGPVRRNKSEAVWARFRAACDLFFERFKRRDEIDLQSKQADREALVAELEGLAPPSAGSPEGAPAVHGGAEGLLERVRSLRSRWNLSPAAVRHGADPLSARFMGALERVMTAYPTAFAGTELDVEANRQRMERLCARVEALTAEQAAAQPAAGSQALAEMLREALAANTIGGRGGEESKWRSMADEVKQAQASWNRLGPVPGEAGRALTDRFHRACSRFQDQYRRKVPPQQAQRGRPVGTR